MRAFKDRARLVGCLPSSCLAAARCRRDRRRIWRASRTWPRSMAFATTSWSATGWWSGCAAPATVRRRCFPPRPCSRCWSGWASPFPRPAPTAPATCRSRTWPGSSSWPRFRPSAEPGNKLDITVSSAGDARSLEGGILLMTPLYGPDGQIFAEAQGALVLGGYMAAGGGNARQMNHPTTARIPGGALVERPVPFDLKQMHTGHRGSERRRLSIPPSGWPSAIDQRAGLGARACRRQPPHSRLPPSRTRTLPPCWTRSSRSKSRSIPRARVVVNERTGTVVIGGTVRLQPVSILHGGFRSM